MSTRCAELRSVPYLQPDRRRRAMTRALARVSPRQGVFAAVYAALSDAGVLVREESSPADHEATAQGTMNRDAERDAGEQMERSENADRRAMPPTR